MSERSRELMDLTGVLSSPVRRAFVTSSADHLNLVAVDEMICGSNPPLIRQSHRSRSIVVPCSQPCRFSKLTQLLTRFALHHGHGRHQVSRHPVSILYSVFSICKDFGSSNFRLYGKSDGLEDREGGWVDAWFANQLADATCTPQFP